MNEKVTLSLTMEQIEVVKRELIRNQVLDTLNGIRQPRETRTWQNLIDEANELYGAQERLTGLRKKLLQLWALIWYGIDKAWNKLDEMNRG